MRLNVNQNKKIRTKHLSGKIAQALEIPMEVTKDLPVVRLIGSAEIQVENFITLIEYSPQKVRLNTKSGILTIDGIALVAKSMSKERMIIHGTILQIAYLV